MSLGSSATRARESKTKRETWHGRMTESKKRRRIGYTVGALQQPYETCGDDIVGEELRNVIQKREEARRAEDAARDAENEFKKKY